MLTSIGTQGVHSWLEFRFFNEREMKSLSEVLEALQVSSYS